MKCANDMKKIFIIILFLFTRQLSFGQSQEVQQLLLDVEKLTQFKQILSDLKKGYEILNGGYEAIKSISQGNFNLHQTFLNGLLQVSPAVKKYERIADIVKYQLRIVNEYKAAFNQFKADKNFTADEIDYMGKVYSHLFNESVKNLDDLITVITADKLRMSDDERLKAIDHIW
ncbi:MAG: TerB family tellurite resistance protein, partial [Bacteroidetes bacterium]|nr:TerB family tellurite resistance protein [Bacteroidota bacterium]